MTQAHSKQQWLGWINEQEQSGLSAAAFCRHKKINADNFYYHKGQHRKNHLPVDSHFVRAQFMTEPAATSYTSIKVKLGDLTIDLPLDKPLQAAEFINALR